MNSLGRISTATIHSLALFFGLLVDFNPVRADEVTTRRFLDEAPAAWQSILAYLSKQEGTVVDTGEALAGLPPSQNFKVVHEFKHSGDNVLHSISGSEGSTLINTVDVLNSRYGFRLSKDNQNPSTPWTTQYVGPRARIKDRIEKTGEILSIPIMIDMQSLLWTTSMPGFSVRKADVVIRDGHEFVLVDFESTDVFRPDYKIVSGRVLLDPSRKWAVLEYELDILLDEPGKMFGTVEYSTTVNGVPIPSRVIKDQVFESAGVRRRRTLEFKRMEACKASASDFLLPAFGLPEVGIGSEKKDSTALVWLTALAVVCLAIAAWFHRRSRSGSVKSKPG